MNTIVEEYERLARRTARPCYSVTFWRTTDGSWGARAGLGGNAFADKLEDAIGCAVDNGIVEQDRRNEAARVDQQAVDGSKE